MWRLSRHYTNVWTPAAVRAAATPVAQVFLGFSRFPLVRSTADRENFTTVRFEDMRFSAPRPPGPPRRASNEPSTFFTVTVRVGPGGEITEQKLGR